MYLGDMIKTSQYKKQKIIILALEETGSIGVLSANKFR